MCLICVELLMEAGMTTAIEQTTATQTVTTTGMTEN